MSKMKPATTAEHTVAYHVISWGLRAACPCGWEFECTSPALTERAGQVHLRRATQPPIAGEGR